MATTLKLRRGTTAQHSTFTGTEGEVTVDTDKDTVVVHDGSTAGGFPLARDSAVLHTTGAESVAGLKTFGDGIATDTIAEETSATGVTIDGVLLKDSQVTTDQINEKTSAAGVTIDGVLLKDGLVNSITVGLGAGAVSTNTAVGASALAGSNTGDGITAVGQQALYANTTGFQNAAVGKEALKANTTGFYNNAVGAFALGGNTTGNYNNAFGRIALYANTTGSNNTAIGQEALQANTTASNNTAVGYQAGYSNTTGKENVSVGTKALYSNTTSDYSVAVGHKAGEASTGERNLFLGAYTGYLNTTGSYNTFVGGGANCGTSMTTGSKNTILGAFTGNQGGLDIRTASNYIVLSDGDGNPRGIFDNSGIFLVGKSGTSSSNVGAEISPTGFCSTTRNGLLALYNRITTDGDLISFRQDGNEEGTISVSGTTVSYNGGHLARWSQLPDNSKDETILKGTVLTNLNDMCVWTKDGTVLPNEQLNKMKVSDVEGDTNVAGVFVNWTRDEDCNSDDMNIAMTGDMIIRIAGGVLVQQGDLLMSAGDGTAKPQGDDIVRSKTIAKVTSNYVTCTYDDGSYCVPCVLMAC